MSISTDARIRECTAPTDRAPPAIETLDAHRSSAQSNNSFFLVPVSPPKANPIDLEFSDIGRDPRFMNGRWLGLAIIIAAALGAGYMGFFSVFAALALAVVR
jgi:hypothetical protein